MSKNVDRYEFWSNKELTISFILVITLTFINLILDCIKIILSKQYVSPFLIYGHTILFIFVIWFVIVASIFVKTRSKYIITKEFIKRGSLFGKKIYWDEINSIRLFEGKYLHLIYDIDGCNNKLFAINILGVSNNTDNSKKFINTIISYVKSYNKHFIINYSVDKMIDSINESQKLQLFRFINRFKFAALVFGLLLIINTKNIVELISLDSSLDVITILRIFLCLSILIICLYGFYKLYKSYKEIH